MLKRKDCFTPVYFRLLRSGSRLWKRSATPTVCMIAGMALCLTACDKDDSDETDNPTPVETPITPPKGAFPIVEKTFQYYWSSGYVQYAMSVGYQGSVADTGGDNLECNLAAFEFSETYYNGMSADTVYISYSDIAINAECEDGQECLSDLAEDENITPGFLIFTKTTARGGAAKPSLTLEGNYESEYFRYVSVVKFALSATSTSGSGLKLYKSINHGEYKLVGTYMPEQPDMPEFFAVEFNESNINFRFEPADDNAGYMRLHDLNIYTDGLPETAEVIVDEQFNDLAQWPMEGIRKNEDGTYPPIPYVDYTPEIPAGKDWPESDAGVKGMTLVAEASYNTVSDIVKTVTYPSGASLTYTIHDGAVNPYCYNHHGNLSLVWQLTKGYIDLPVQKSKYPRKDIDASLEITGLQNVSLAELWLSTDSMECNYEIYYKTDAMSEYKLLSHYVQARFAGIGKYMRFNIGGAASASLLIRPGEGSRNGQGVSVGGKIIGIERKTKVHGLRLWRN